MLSTPDSDIPDPKRLLPGFDRGTRSQKSLTAIKLSIALAVSCFAVHLAAQTNPPTTQTGARDNDPLARASRLFIEADRRFRAAPTNAEAAWEFGRAAFDWAELATNNSQRAAIAEQGIAACRQAIGREPNAAAGHYYLALNLGRLADATRSFGGLKLVAEMEHELKAARQIEPDFDFAGPDRSLGMLYRDAPGWPISVGNRSKARFHLRKAMALAPAYPENRFCLLEAHLAWGDRKAARAEMETTEAALEKARTDLVGEQWAGSWADWEKRWAKLKARVQQSLPPLQAPRAKAN